jgi:signal transduction histidine kinase/ActR/RegA family two-component response regulator
MSDPILRQLFAALDLAVLEPRADGSLQAIAELPDWWQSPDGAEMAAAGRFCPEDDSPFLRAFLADAERFWADGQAGWISSGIWQETLPRGEDCHLEASAATIAGRKVLIVRRVDPAQDDRLTVVQKGRDNKLAYQRDLAARERLETELRRAKQAAEALVQAKSHFLARMSHELRTPMAGVIGMTQLLLDAHPTTEQRGYLEAVGQSANSLLALINDILDFSRAEAAKLTLARKPFLLRELIADSLMLLDAAARDKGLKIACDIDPAVPNDLIGDPLRLRQILFNLVGNAVKFTEAGEVSLAVACEPTSGDAQPGQLQFTVRDTGIGIPAAQQQDIFEAFAQADTTAGRQFEGAGLGLSIARQLVELMGGRLWLVDSSARGSTFCFTAPFELAAPRAAKKTRVEAAAPVAAARSLRILIADDNEINRHVAIRMLQKRGHQPVAVVSGAAALAALEREPFDAILMDCLMPGLDGFETTAAVRRRERGTGLRVPIIALTAQASPEDRERCLAAGMDAHLTKPLHADRLVALLEELTAKERTLENAPPNGSNIE